MIAVLTETLPCADPNCKDIMKLMFQNERFLGYRCLQKPNTHNFRYNVERERWEKIIIKTKPIIGYQKSPYEALIEEKDLTIESL